MSSCLILLCADQTFAVDPKAPPGFTIEKVSPAETKFPMFAALDDRGRLFVAESSGLDLYLELQKQTRKCRIRLLEDRDNDGRYETSQVFQDQLVFPMGVAWRDGKLYVPDPPDLLIVEDTDNDGRADRKTKILTGFGHQDNGSLHGVTFGPDGMLYMTTGSPDGYKLKRPDGSILSGESGALFRCNPDGSDPQVLCRGFENLVEIAFMPGGQIIGTDNWFQRPFGGARDALVHLLPGAHYPLHERDKGTQFLTSGEPLPAIAMFPAVALSGLMRYEGYAFPGEFRYNNLFSAQHNARAVGRHIIRPVRSTFTSEDSEFITSEDPDFHPSDVLEDADGSILVVDTGGWYVQHCPTGKIRNSKAPGGIYRVRYNDARPIEDPRGLKIDWEKTSSADLVKLLSDKRVAVAKRAQRTLIARGPQSIPDLAKELPSAGLYQAPNLRVWALAQIGTEDALAPLRERLRNPRSSGDLTVISRALASRKDRGAIAGLEYWTAGCGSHPRVACAEALAVVGRRESIPALIKALIDPDIPPERFLEHSIINALYHLGTVEDFRAALAHDHPKVQKAALILLDQPTNRALKAEDVFPRLSFTDAELRATALSLLKNHPDWSDPALAYFQRTWKDDNLSPEATAALLESVLAFSSNQKVIDWLGQAFSQTSSAPRQILILQTMARIPPPKSFATWVEPLHQSLSAPDLLAHALHVIASLTTAEFDEKLKKLVLDTTQSPQLRLDALRPLISRDPRLQQATFDLLLSQLASQSPALRLTAAELISRSHLSYQRFTQLLDGIKNDRLISPDTLVPLLTRSANEKNAAPLLAYLKKSIDSGWRPPVPKIRALLDPLATSHAAQVDELLKTLREHADTQADRLAQLEPLLKDGNPSRGREVFFANQVACSTCHRIGDQGGLVGPDLTKVGAIRAGRDILESIIFPASTIAQGYENYIITLKNGDVLTGIITGTPHAHAGLQDTITLRDSSSATRILRSGDIKNSRRDTTSLMPQGLETALTPEQFRDLLAFLQTLK